MRRALLSVVLAGCAARDFALDSPIGQADLGVQPTADRDVARFVVVGDIGKWSGVGTGPDGAVVEGDLSPGFRAVAAAIRGACADTACDFVLVTGDNLYENGIERDEDADALKLMVESYGLPTWFVLGNHDWRWVQPELETARRELRWIAETDGVHGEAHFWRMSAGPVSFWGVDSNLLVREGHYATDRWIEAWLRTIEQDERSPWRVGVAHHPVYSNGQHGDAGRFLDGGYKLWRGEEFRSALDAFVLDEVDVWFNGHDHNLQWFADGSTAFVTSGSGAKCNPAGDDDARFWPGRPDPSMTRFERGFAIVEATPESMEITFHSLELGAFWTARRGVSDDAWTLPDGERVDATTYCPKLAPPAG